MKPKIFIGSSREGVKIANAIHSNLTYDAECTVWTDGVFQLSSNTLSSLIDALRAADFGIFVFSPDDLTVMRGVQNSTVRDNVLFELGLFIGRLGQERCYFLVPDGTSDLKLPSDLAGVTPGRYESERSDGNWEAALNPACMQIKRQVERLKSFQDAIHPEPASTTKTLITNSSPTASPNGSGDISARFYKKGILLTGDTKSEKERIKTIGRWNSSLSGWIVPRSKEKLLRAEFPDLVIHPAEVS
ncbi:MAG: hypothetical protein GQ539_09540 [Sulfitobacter sp.]|nr:hypothetical protein [Sulfitobacter sp.]